MPAWLRAISVSLWRWWKRISAERVGPAASSASQRRWAKMRATKLSRRRGSRRRLSSSTGSASSRSSSAAVNRPRPTLAGLPGPSG